MEKVNLGEYVRIKTGKLDANDSNINGKYPFFTCSNEPLRINDYSYDCECVLVAGNGDLNVKYYNGKFDAYQRTYIIEVKDKNLLNTKFLYYLINANIEQLRRNAIGGVIKYIKLGNLTNIKFELTKMNKQNHIVEELDKVQNIIDLRKKQIEKLDEIVKSQFVEMFGNPILNEKNWKLKKLKDLSNKVMSGNTPKGGEKNYVKNGIAFYRSQNVWKNKLELDNVVYIDEEMHNRMKKSSLKHNDLLITKTGRINTENSSLGRTARYEGEDDKANINGHVYLVRLNKDVNNEFILRILISDAYREHIRSVCVGGIDKRQLNKEHIENFPIIYPPEALQRSFVKFVKQIEKEKIIIEKSLKQIEEIQESLMNKYFS